MHGMFNWPHSRRTVIVTMPVTGIYSPVTGMVTMTVLLLCGARQRGVPGAGGSDRIGAGMRARSKKLQLFGCWNALHCVAMVCCNGFEFAQGC